MKSLTKLELLSLKISGKIQKNLSAQLLTVFLIFSGTHSYAAKVKVGEAFGGGMVFCVSGTADLSRCVTEGSGEYGLIMANEDQVNFDSNPDHGVTWSSDYGSIPGAQSEDDGAANTAAIIKKFPNDNPANNAAQLCSKYKDPSEGHTDWYLPAINELNKMYLFAKANNLIGKGCTGNKFNGTVQCLVGGYEENDKTYWSSKCSGYSYAGNNHGAWFQYFINGRQFGLDKTYDHFAVRAIRAFNNSPIQQFTKVEAKSSGDPIKSDSGWDFGFSGDFADWGNLNTSNGLSSQRMQEDVMQRETKSSLWGDWSNGGKW